MAGKRTLPKTHTATQHQPAKRGTWMRPPFPDMRPETVSHIRFIVG